MRPAPLVLALVMAAPAAAQKPWETRVDLPVKVPVELPEVPPSNPFAAALTTPVALLQAPMREKFNASAPAHGAAYIDAGGACRRVVVLTQPWPGVAQGVQQALLETAFTPARFLGQNAQIWAPFTVELSGRIREGRAVRLTASPPDPAAPPQPDVAASPTADARDLSLPATPVENLDQLPAAKRFRVKIPARTWSQRVALLTEVTPAGTCGRMVFLSCPEGLRNWLLASAASWSFQPGGDATGPVTAWVHIEGEIEVDCGPLEAETLRINRQSSYPRAGAAPAGVRPPGA
ncbi:MAG: hypothetical protein AB1625_10015 [Acidobacteriota bacterium]